jgi:Tfp pilus assembly protein PilO
MDFKNMPFWGQFAVVAALSIALVAVAWMAYPNFGEMSKRNAGERSKLEGLQMKLNDLLQILPTEPETGELLKWVKNLTDQSNLELMQFNPGALRPVEFYKEFPIHMEILGDYHDLGVFFDRISKYSRIINVSGVNISARRQGRQSISSNFTATTFVYEDDQGGAQ